MRRFLLAVDNFYPDPDRVREQALRMEYVQPESLVGWRTRPLFVRGVKERIERTLRLPITTWPDDPDDAELGNGSFFFGLSTGRLAERVGVHFDTPSEMVTMLVYLTPGAPYDAGTSLWQHRPTGLLAKPRPADARRLGTTVEELEDRIDRDSRNPRRWREIDRVGNVYNRATFYRSGMLHSATRHFGSNVQNGRIYQTFRFGVDWGGKGRPTSRTP
ncbi:MAG TPA: DUF6445 family protein [Thermoanaerobaculia bacterium]|jgi:hypothetical protein